MPPKPVVLFVDDEPATLEGLQLTQRKRYDVRVASSASAGLKILAAEPEIAAVVSDMRMPEMDGAAFLAKVREVAPDAVRLLLTGHADIDASVRAVNEGRIFHYLTKPCSPEQVGAALASAVEMHRLISTERTLLQQTLVGSVKAVISVLGLTNPAALARAMHIRDRASEAAMRLGIENRWSIEFAALLSQIGAACLPEAVVGKLRRGQPLDAVETEELAQSIGAVTHALREIPHLEPVVGLLDELSELTIGNRADAVHASANARLLHALIDLESQESAGVSFEEALLGLRQNEKKYGSETLAALTGISEKSEPLDAVICSPGALKEGMVLADDLHTTDGLLLLPRGFELSRSSLEHIINKFSDWLPQRIRIQLESTEASARMRSRG